MIIILIVFFSIIITPIIMFSTKSITYFTIRSHIKHIKSITKIITIITILTSTINIIILHICVANGLQYELGRVLYL
jgi:hypothetical protein